MRTIPVLLSSALTASPRRGAECLVLIARDGTVAGFTTWDKSLEIDLSPDGGPDTPVNCVPHLTLSAVTLATGFDASSFEATLPARGEFAASKLLGGKWRHATAWLVRASPGMAGFAPIMRGRCAETRRSGHTAVLEIRNAAAAFNQSQGSVIGPYCRADFGVAATGCPVIREPIASTVTAVQDAFTFAVDLAGDHPDNWFFLGTAEFLSGALVGTAEAKVFAYDGTTGGIELFEPLLEPPQVGDTLNLYRGCSRLLKNDNPIVPSCKTWGAAADFRGEPEVPGNRFYHRVSSPGAAYA